MLPLCRNCSTPNREEAKRCWRCGSVLDKSPEDAHDAGMTTDHLPFPLTEELTSFEASSIADKLLRARNDLGPEDSVFAQARHTASLRPSDPTYLSRWLILHGFNAEGQAALTEALTKGN